MEYIKEGHMTRYRKGTIKDTEQFVYCKLQSLGPDQRPEIHGFTDASSSEANFVLKIKSFATVSASDTDVPKIVKAKYDNYICIRPKGKGGALTYLAADSKQQRDEWCELLRGFFDNRPVSLKKNGRDRLQTDSTANRPTPKRNRRAGTVNTAPATAVGTFQQELMKTIQKRETLSTDQEQNDDQLCCPRHHEDKGSNIAGHIYENVHLVPNLQKWREEQKQSRNILQKQSQLYKDLHQLTGLQKPHEEGIEGAYGDALGVRERLSQGNRWSSSSSSSEEEQVEGPATLRSTLNSLPSPREPCETTYDFTNEATDEGVPDYAPPAPPPKKQGSKKKDSFSSIKDQLEEKLAYSLKKKLSSTTPDPESGVCWEATGKAKITEIECGQVHSYGRKMSLPTLERELISQETSDQSENMYINRDMGRRRPESRPNLLQKPGIRTPTCSQTLPHRDTLPLPPPPTLPRNSSKTSATPALPKRVIDKLEKLRKEKIQRNVRVQIPRALLMIHTDKGLLLRQKHDDILITRVPQELSKYLRIGDQVIKINDQLLTSVAYAYSCIALSDKSDVNLTVIRIPSATICSFRWVSRDVRDIGLELNGPKITDLSRRGLAVCQGHLQSQETQSMLSASIRCNYVITEINFLPVDPDASTPEVHEMLLRAGKDIVLILHPEDFVSLQRYPEEDIYENMT